MNQEDKYGDEAFSSYDGEHRPPNYKFIQNIQVWFVEARTGCTCCASDNFQTGPFETEALARGCVEDYTRTRRLSSQFSRTGVYRILGPEEAELMPDGRVIVGDRVFSEWGREYCR